MIMFMNITVTTAVICVIIAISALIVAQLRRRLKRHECKDLFIVLIGVMWFMTAFSAFFCLVWPLLPKAPGFGG